MRRLLVLALLLVGPALAGPQVLLDTGETVLGQPVVYPGGEARVTAVIVTLAPGQSTGPHEHGTPMFAYMLEGQISVDYGAAGMHSYAAGDALVEAFMTRHEGVNHGATPARILVVFMGAEGARDTVMLE